MTDSVGWAQRAGAAAIVHAHSPASPTAPRSESPWPCALALRRPWKLVNHSGLGWACLFVAVAWELFAIVFARRVGWGFGAGWFFFVWGLGILGLAFYWRASRLRPGVPGLFLGVNLLMVGVLSWVAAF